MIAPQRADDAHRNRLADAERVADGKDHVTHAHLFHAAQRDGGEVVERDLEHREVGFGVAADQLGARLAAVGKGDFDLVGPVHHVMIRENIAFAAHNHTRAKARDRVLPHCAAAVAKEIPEQRIIEARIAILLLFLAGKNADDRRHRLLRAIGVRAGRRLLGQTRRDFLQGDDGIGQLLAERTLALQPLRLEGGDDEEQRKQHGDRLREQ